MGEDGRTWEGFVRQRRNLHIVSLLLSFVYLAGLEVKSEQEFAGIGVTIENPGAIFSALWVGWVYWLWRFYTYLRDLGSEGLVSAYNQRLLELAKRRVHKELPDAIRRAVEFDEPPIGPVTPGYSRLDLGSREQERWIFTARELAAGYRTAGGQGQVQIGDFTIALSDTTLQWLRARAVLHVIFHTHFVSEYVLPFFVAGLPVLAFVWRLSQA